MRVVRHRIGLGLEPVEAHIQTLSPGPVDSLGGQVNLDGCDHFVQGVPHCEQVLGDGIQDCAQLGPVGLAPFEREPVALTFLAPAVSAALCRFPSASMVRPVFLYTTIAVANAPKALRTRDSNRDS